MGKSTISMTMFNSFLYVYQRVSWFVTYCILMLTMVYDGDICIVDGVDYSTYI